MKTGVDFPSPVVMKKAVLLAAPLVMAVDAKLARRPEEPSDV